MAVIPRFLLIFLSFIYLTNAYSLFFRGRPRGGMLGKPFTTANYVLPPEQWLDQKLNHFDFSDGRTWKQRYFVNDTFYKSGGPVFLMIGGEGEAQPVWMVEGQWIKMAQFYNALCFMLEHRYYGKSHPTDDLSTKNLHYLNSEQALADLAHFRNHMMVTNKLTNNKWIAFGGSYPGSLAAWFRIKYPHLVDGAVATSAPVFAEINFKDYLGVVDDVLDLTNPKCGPMIKEAVATLTDMLSSEEGRHQLGDIFKLCDVLKDADDHDIKNLYSSLAGNFENVIQYNNDNRAFEGAKGTNITIGFLCNIMTNESIGSTIRRFATVNDIILKTYEMPCLEYKYQKFINDMSQTSWKSSMSEGGRQWTYQTCTEFGFFQSSDLPDQPFGQFFPESFFMQQCADIFGTVFTRELLQQGINRTNTDYGGFGLKVTKIVFPNGSIDPWHALGITKDLSPDAKAIFINGTAHCANMYPDADNDPLVLRQARKQITNIIGTWLK